MNKNPTESCNSKTLTERLREPLTIDQIDFRIQSINKGGYATILAYKDARVDMHRLNDVFGVGCWQKKYELINGNLFCSVGVLVPYTNEQQWAWVQDVGTESKTEKEKGQASDAFKRACFNLGIGIELYNFPEIKVKLNSDEFELKTYNNKQIGQATWKLKLKEWEWYMERDDEKMTFLAARDQDKNTRFQWGER